MYIKTSLFISLYFDESTDVTKSAPYSVKHDIKEKLFLLLLKLKVQIFLRPL